MKVVNYVIEKMVLEKPLDNVNTEGTFPPGGHLPHSSAGDISFRSGLKPWQKLRPSIEILCNNQASGYIQSAVKPSFDHFLLAFKAR